MGFIRVATGPTSEPITLAEAKAHLRLEESVDDVYVTALITAARQHIERVCWRGMLEQSLVMELPGFRGADKRELPPAFGPGGGDGFSGFSGYAGGYNPVQAYGGSRFQSYIELLGGHLSATPAIAVTYLDVNAAVQTLAAATYVVQGAANDRMCGRIWLNTNGGYSWPDVLDRFDAVRIAYTVGWTSATIPGPLKQAMFLLISQMYEYRTPEITGTIATTLEFTIDALTSAYRFLRL